MTPAAAWHPAEEVLQDYVDGRLAGLSAGSVEAHVLRCATCRAGLREGVPAERLARTREALEDRLDLAERPRLERLLLRLGADEADARALHAAPSLRVAWWLAVAGAIALALLASGSTQRSDAVFLLLAPLLPLATTALAYAPALDPAFALVAATPYRSARMLLARSLAVGGTSLVAVTLVAVLLPQRDLTAAGWLLPASALTLLVLALAPRLGVGAAAGVVGGAWVALVAGLQHEGVAVGWVQEAAAQGTAGAITAAALAVVVHQWSRLDRGSA